MLSFLAANSLKCHLFIQKAGMHIMFLMFEKTQEKVKLEVTNLKGKLLEQVWRYNTEIKSSSFRWTNAVLLRADPQEEFISLTCSIQFKTQLIWLKKSKLYIIQNN